MSKVRRLSVITIICALIWLPVASWVFMVGTDLWTESNLFPRAGYVPTWQWWTYSHLWGEHRAVTLWLKIGAWVASAPLLFCAIGWVKVPFSRDQKLHGESRWATVRDARKADLRVTWRPPGDGILLGKTEQWPHRYVSLKPEQHASATARSRTGKGVSIAIPNCLVAEGSLVAFSVKRDLWTAAASERRRKGQQTFIFEPGNPDLKTHRWNPLGKVPRHGHGIYDAIQRVMYRIIPPSKANNPFFDDAGRRWATALGVILAETPGAKLNVAAIKRTLSRTDRVDFIHDLIDRARMEGRPLHQAAVDTTLGWLNRVEEDKEVRSVLETVLTHMSLWDNEIIAAVTEESDFDLSRIRTDPMSIFVVIGVSEMARLRPLLKLFMAELVAQNTKHDFKEGKGYKHRVKGVFDEFWAVGDTPEMMDAVSFIASAGFDLCYITQSKQQIEKIQGKAGAENLFLNTTEVYFAGADMRSAEEISKRGGNDTVEEVSHSKPSWMPWMKWDKHNENHQQRARPVILAQEVSTLDRRKLIVVKPTMRLLKLNRIFYYEDPSMAWMEAPPPVVPKLTVVTERDTGPVPIPPPVPAGVPMTIGI